MAWKKIIFSGSAGEMSSLAVDGNITGKFIGAVSSSAQLATDISGSFISASDSLQGQIDSISTSFTLSADSGTNDSFNSGETLTFAGANGINTTVTNNQIQISAGGQLISGAAQLATDISGSLSNGAIAGLRAGILSGSVHNGMTLSGSFSGSYIGDGSGLSGITVSQAATVTSNFTNQTSVAVDHNFGSRNINVAVYNTSNVQLIPASVTLTSTNRVTVAFDSSTSGYIVVAQGGHVVSGSTSATNISGLAEAVSLAGFAVTGSTQTLSSSAQIGTDISGSFISASNSLQSQINGISTSFTLSADSGTNDSFSSGGTLTFDGANGINTVVSNDKITITAGGQLISGAAQVVALVESGTDSNTFTDADHSKLNAIEASADVTDTTNVTAAGALMDSELTNLAAVKAINQSLVTSASPTFVGLTLTGDLEVRGTTTSIASTTVDIGDNIVALNGTGAALGGLHVNDANGPKSGSLLWDGTNNKWIGGQSGSEVDVAFLKGQGLVSSSAQIGTGISGSFVSASNSLQGQINTNTTGVSNIEGRSIVAGTGLTGGGNLGASRTVNVASANNGIVANADNIELAVASSTFTGGVDARINAKGVISASAQIEGDFLNTTGDGVISSSAQIGVGDGLLTQNNFTNALKSKLDGIEASADVTDATNVTAAGALMDSEVSNLALIKALSAASISGSFISASNSLQAQIDSTSTSFTLAADSGTNDAFNSSETLTFEGGNGITTVVSNNKIAINGAGGLVSGSAQVVALVEAGTDSNTFTDADHSKLNAIEASADVTDTANVTSAGALMDSEVASLALIKSLTAADISGSLSAGAIRGAGANLISASVLSSPSQGTARLAINGVNTDVDLGLQAGDSPSFTNLTVSGDLTVTGNTFEAQVTNLNVEDKFITVNSGSSSGESGIVFGGADPAGSGATNQGTAIFWDSTNVFGFAQDVASTATAATLSSKLGNIETSNSNPTSAPTFQGTGTTHVNESDESIWIYS